MAEPPITFAGLLRKLRTEPRLTQEELAQASGVRPRSISDLERGVAASPQRDAIRRLADALTLSRDIASFTGRQHELQELVNATASAAQSGGVVSIHAISGMAGIGKTAFAVHATHQLAPRFPGGQIFLPLHRHTKGHQPLHAVHERAHRDTVSSAAGALLDHLSQSPARLAGLGRSPLDSGPGPCFLSGRGAVVGWCSGGGGGLRPCEDPYYHAQCWQLCFQPFKRMEPVVQASPGKAAVKGQEQRHDADPCPNYQPEIELRQLSAFDEMQSEDECECCGGSSGCEPGRKRHCFFVIDGNLSRFLGLMEHMRQENQEARD